MHHPLTVQRIIALWLPLALTWAMMALEGPIIQSIISRLPHPSFNLAALGVAISIAFIVESPIIMLLSASTAYVKGPRSYSTLRRFAIVLSVGVSTVMVLLLLPPIWEVVSRKILSLPQQLTSTVYWCLVALIPWPGVIGIRRFYQGILIRAHLNRFVAIGTVFRLITIIVGGIILFWLLRSSQNSAIAGSVVLSSAVTIELLATSVMARRAVKQICAQDIPEDIWLTHHQILRLYFPLAMTSFITMGIGPVLTAFMSRSAAALASLAAFPVVDGVVFQFRSALFAYQEVAISLLGRNSHDNRLIVRSGYIIALVATGVLGLVAFTPLSTIIYGMFPFSLPADIIPFAQGATQIFITMPILSALFSIDRAYLIVHGRSKHVSYSTLFEAGGTIIMLGIFYVFASNYPGIYGATWAAVIGKIVAAIYLEQKLYPYRTARALRTNAV